MDDMHDRHEMPTADAARGVGHYVSGALAAADVAVRLLTWLRSQGRPTPEVKASDLLQARTVLDPREDAYRKMLGPRHRDVGSHTALLAWVVAQPHRDQDAQSEVVAARAEARLRSLHPDAMGRYASLRVQQTPVEAMQDVAPVIFAEARQAAGTMGDDAAYRHIVAGKSAGVTPERAGRADEAPPEVRYRRLLREVLTVDVAERVVQDASWPRLAGALQAAERAGAPAADVLLAAAKQRELGSAKSVAQVLAFRVHRQSQQDPGQGPARHEEARAAAVAAHAYPVPLALPSARGDREGAARGQRDDVMGQAPAVAGAVAPERVGSAAVSATPARPDRTADAADASRPARGSAASIAGQSYPGPVDRPGAGSSTANAAARGATPVVARRQVSTGSRRL